MELQELYGLMNHFAASGLTVLEWEREGERVALRREPAASSAAPATALAATSPAVPEPEEPGELVTAPLVGVFYAAPSPEEPPYVTQGGRVKKGDTLCLIEAMKMMSQVPAPADCVVEKVLAQDGEAVGVGAPLFRIRRV